MNIRYNHLNNYEPYYQNKFIIFYHQYQKYFSKIITIFDNIFNLNEFRLMKNINLNY